MGLMMKVEHTDTYGGESNYSWVHRYEYEIPLQKENGFKVCNMTRRAIVQKAKKLTGLTGIRCDVNDFGDMISIHPHRICQVVFVTFES